MVPGGWCPAGRLAEDGTIPGHYRLRESPTAEYAERTEWNVRDSDGTLIVTIGEPTGGTGLTVRLARRLGRPLFVLDVERRTPPGRFAAWVERHGVRVLNVAGPRRSQWRAGYRTTLGVLNTLLDADLARTEVDERR